MAITVTKVPTLEQMKKDRYKKVLEVSTQGFLNNIHGAICAKMDFVDIPFFVYNEEDKEILDKVIVRFRDKNYNIEKMAEIPQQQMTPSGLVSFTNFIHRFTIGE